MIINDRMFEIVSFIDKMSDKNSPSMGENITANTKVMIDCNMPRNDLTNPFLVYPIICITSQKARKRSRKNPTKIILIKFLSEL